ncbi:MAG: YjjG family noncanonical pyrimidine nucleotidase [Spirochaetaceae bacterium]|nr:YjjG family noncanonical pyrimidine nucleotidase [Spirochaetaceae bacterium]
MKYKHFLFDADNTIFDYSCGEKNAFYEIGKIFNIEFDTAVLNVYHRVNKACWQAYERGELSQEKLLVLRFKNFCEELSLDIDPFEFDRLFTLILSQQTCLMPYAREVLDILKNDGYNIWMITNGVRETQYGRAKASGIESYFSNYFISSDMGCQKPDIEFFDIVLNTIKAERDECLIIGDRLESDIEGGLRSSIDTIWLNTNNNERGPLIVPTFEIESLEQMMDLIK